MPKKYRGDQRNKSLAAETRHGVVSLDTTMIKNAKPPKVDSYLIDYVKNRLGLTILSLTKL